MTLGALGGALKPLSRAQVLALPPVVNLATLGKALGLSEPTIREAYRRGEIEAMGVRVLRLGVQYRIPSEDIWRLLGITPDSSVAAATTANGPQDGESGPDPPGPLTDQAAAVSSPRDIRH